ncbi:hypothetical protein [Methylotenera mobilis]|nr:hypothetical protein [Methylotenera mobilis]
MILHYAPILRTSLVRLWRSGSLFILGMSAGEWLVGVSDALIWM